MDPVTAFPRGPARAPAGAAPETLSGPGRRHLLGLIAAGLAPAAAAQDGQRARPGGKGAAECQSFHGRHQAGIATPQPAAANVALFDVTAGLRDGLVALMKRLTVRTAASCRARCLHGRTIQSARKA